MPKDIDGFEYEASPEYLAMQSWLIAMDEEYKKSREELEEKLSQHNSIGGNKNGTND